MADKRAFLKLDVGYLTNPKVAAVSLESPTAVLLHLGSIAYSAQHLTDGVVPVKLLLRLTGATPTDAALLIDGDLWVDLKDGNAGIHDYLEHQRSAADAKGAAEKATKAANARWAAEQDDASMPLSMLPGMPDASASSMPREKREREKKDTPSQAAPAGPDFDAFWAVYPKNVGGKVAAHKAFVKAVSLVSLDVVLAGAKRYAADPNLPDRQFIPNPATWLNQGRWEDDPCAPRTDKPNTTPRAGSTIWDRTVRSAS